MIREVFEAKRKSMYLFPIAAVINQYWHCGHYAFQEKTVDPFWFGLLVLLRQVGIRLRVTSGNLGAH